MLIEQTPQELAEIFSAEELAQMYLSAREEIEVMLAAIEAANRRNENTLN